VKAPGALKSPVESLCKTNVSQDPLLGLLSLVSS
jgi:hypothetical protein